MRVALIGLLGIAATIACSGSGGGGDISGGSGGSNPAPGTGSNNPAGGGDNSSDPTENGTTVPKSVTSKLAANIGIAEVAVFQALKGSIAKDGKEATPGVPLVAGRDALFRVYVKPTADFESRKLKAVLRLVSQDGKPIKAITEEKTIDGASKETDLDSTFNFEVPGGFLPEGVKYAVAITDEKATPSAEGDDNDARFPKDGKETEVGVQSTGPSVRIVIVPIKYTADGSSRLPDVSQQQLDLDSSVVWAMYPTPKVEVTVRSSPFTWSHQIAANGSGWGQLLESLANLREQDGADDDVYYWGAFRAAGSQQGFCGNACVMGLSTVVSDPADSYYRASIGVGFSGQDSAETMAHEIGHAHGRNHAPCSDFGQIDGVDPKFPHQDAQIGLPAFDLVSKSLVSQSDARDLMAYCQPPWVSDYTYKALFNRISAVNQGKALNLPPEGDPTGNSSNANRWAQLPAPAKTRTRIAYQTVLMGAEGPESFGIKTTSHGNVRGEMREIELLDAKKNVIGHTSAHYHSWNHIPGGTLMIPESAGSYAGIKIGSRTLMR